ncbi:LacI family DNA-binding transcriptional regulator [Thermostaphylospora chromogena]|uniref:Transcriptional regulator, LacI family n=1 Tax=Thermostaphylospora chromogena TaxID=35622 RepID=A0A1H1A962_9ACTN|nr:LacI family DNA-binding transcriptional regulator [Thermostaphylospora chromogena]SDQ36120.1 transcriptional regulator, LacI family [Thermostaphylospora chromogena]
MSPPRKRATIREVAKAAGLSPAAVSYALRGMQVSEKTAERVRRVAAELGYEADPIARALAIGKTGVIGLLCGSLEDLWQQSLGVGIGRALNDQDRYALILDAAGDPDRERSLAQRLRDQRVDGLIVQPVDPAAGFWAELCAHLPVVAIGDALAGARTAGEVVFDNRRGATMALEHLRDSGHRRLAVLTPTRPSTPDRPADVHVAAEAERLGLDVTLVTAPHSLAGATGVACDLLARPRPPTAVFCFADSIAYGVYAAAAERGLRIPEDISVMGYDAHPMSGLLRPALTTVDWDIAGIVRAAVRLVLDAVDGGADGDSGGERRRRIVQAPRLVRRASVGAPPR